MGELRFYTNYKLSVLCCLSIIFTQTLFKYLNIFNFKFNLYDVIGVVGFVCLALFNFIQIRDKKIVGFLRFLPKREHSKQTTVLFTSESLIFALLMSAFPSWTLAFPFAGLFYDFTGQTGAVVYFGHLLSSFPFFLLGALLIGVKPFKTLDILTPAYPLALTYGKLACFCAGCCNGIAVDWGFYNYETGLREFPVQLVESVEAIVIFLIMMKIRKKAKLGTMFPLYLVFYSGMRFFSEFLRAQPDILGPLKCAQIFCIAGIVLGFVGFILAEKYAERGDNAFGRIYSKIEKCLCKKFPKRVV